MGSRTDSPLFQNHRTGLINRLLPTAECMSPALLAGLTVGEMTPLAFMRPIVGLFLWMHESREFRPRTESFRPSLLPAHGLAEGLDEFLLRDAAAQLHGVNRGFCHAIGRILIADGDATSLAGDVYLYGWLRALHRSDLDREARAARP